MSPAGRRRRFMLLTGLDVRGLDHRQFRRLRRRVLRRARPLPRYTLADYKALAAADPLHARLLSLVDPEHASFATIRPEDFRG